MRPLAAPIILLTFGALTASCMGSGKTAGGTTTRAETVTKAPPVVTHRQFVKRLDRLCRVYNHKVDVLNKRYASVFNSTDYAAIADVYRKAERQQAPWRVAIGQLEVPSNDQRNFHRYLALTDRMDGMSHREIRALRRQDIEEVRRLDALIERSRDQRTNRAVDLGLRVCGG